MPAASRPRRTATPSRRATPPAGGHLSVVQPEPAAASTGTSGQGATTTERIVHAVTAAIVERRLMPGTKLAEQQLADIFQVSRTVVRQALNQLSRDKLVTLTPARGAYVAQPSVEEARQIFELREMIESAMLRQLAERITPAQVAQLRTHLHDEEEAVHRPDVSGRTRLLADFHTVLARMLGNEVLAEVLQDLLLRGSLIALMVQSAHSAEHSHAEHVAIVDALERGDGKAAAKLMGRHLEHVELNLRQHPRVRDLAGVLQPTDQPAPTRAAKRSAPSSARKSAARAASSAKPAKKARA